MFCQGDLMVGDKTRHQQKWVKAVVGNGHQDLKKKGSFVGFFEHDKENASADFFRLGLAAIVCFLWLSDLCVTQTACGSSASDCLSSPHVLPHSPFLLSLCLPSFLNTWQKVAAKIGQLEEEKLNLENSMVCVEDPRKIVLEKKILWKGNSTTFKGKQANWQIESPRLSSSAKSTWVTAIQGSSLYPTRLGRWTSPTFLKERICSSLERGGCTLAIFWNGNWLTERRWGVG